MASDATLRRMTSSDSIEDLLHRHSECIGSTLANISSLHKFTEIKPALLEISELAFEEANAMKLMASRSKSLIRPERTLPTS